MQKNTLTQKIISGCIAGTDAGSQNSKIAKVLAIIMLILGAISLILPDMLFLAVVCLAVAVLCLVLRAKSARIIQAILRKEYTLREDICVKKGVSPSTDPHSSYLEFANAGRCYLTFSNVIWNSEAFVKSPQLYETASIGDTFYLLYAKGNRILYVFNSKFWSIDTNEFLQTNDLFVPKK